jgi:mRNA interferase MazF
MVRRGDIYWATLPDGAGRRPVCVLTRTAAIDVLDSLVVAPLTRSVRGLRSEVFLDEKDGLPSPCAISCDNVTTIPKAIVDLTPLARLHVTRLVELDRALKFALDIYC